VHFPVLKYSVSLQVREDQIRAVEWIYVASVIVR